MLLKFRMCIGVIPSKLEVVFDDLASVRIPFEAQFKGVKQHSFSLAAIVPKIRLIKDHIISDKQSRRQAVTGEPHLDSLRRELSQHFIDQCVLLDKERMQSE